MAQDLFNNFSFSKTLKLKTKQQELLIRVTVLTLIYILAFITRLFSVLRYESMIHEFDPYFNYRTTLYLTKNDFAKFWNWFDSESYPHLRGFHPNGALFRLQHHPHCLLLRQGDLGFRRRDRRRSFDCNLPWAVNTGSLAWALTSAFGYFYMVST
ncbi:hypothetical protein HN51_061524, partial [Arachis hypogaea]